MQKGVIFCLVIACFLQINNSFEFLPVQNRRGGALFHHEWSTEARVKNVAVRQERFALNMIGSAGNSIQVVLEDFPQIVKAVEIFQRLYLQKKIPSSFVVPEFEEWPEEMHGFRLGKRLEKILGTKSFFTQYPDKVKQLSLVFGVDSVLSLQNTLTDDWFIVFDAIKTYYGIYGDLRIPPNFLVPHQEPWPKLAFGLKLGARVSAIRNVGRYVKDYPLRKDQLDSLGFDWRGRDQIRSFEEEQLFQKICQAIAIYKQTFQSVVIPASYVVPTKVKDFPTILRGLPLGKYIHQIKYENKFISGHPERVNQLHSLGIHLKYDEPSTEIDDRRQKEARLISAALKEYRKQYGRSPVPRSFIVPHQLPWPRDTWGMLLGEKVAEINANAAMIATAPRKNRKKIGGGFVDSFIDENSESGYDDLMQDDRPVLDDEDMDDYAEEDGQKPEDDEELALSSLTQSLTSSESTTPAKKNPNYNPYFEQEIDSFNPFKINSLPPYREIAAEAFNRLEEDYIESGDVRLRRYRVFKNSLDINGINKIMYKTPSAEQIQHMRKMKHRMLEFDQYYWNDVLLGLKLFKRVFGHLDVSGNFVIDEKVISRLPNKKDRKQYMDLIGMKLGEYVIDLRVGDVDGFEDSERRKVLDELGFIWGDPLKYLRFRFPAMASALQMYFLYFGTTIMDEKYVIPDTPIWPEWMIGMELGKWCAIAKIQQNVLRRFYPDRHQILSDMGFTWWLGFMSYYDDYSTPPK